jgi:hypothetical protein
MDDALCDANRVTSTDPGFSLSFAEICCLVLYFARALHEPQLRRLALQVPLASASLASAPQLIKTRQTDSLNERSNNPIFDKSDDNAAL